MARDFINYYEGEMAYLREAGRAFAEAHPDIGRYLGLDGFGERDPFVERLLEGFAFLTGRIRQRLDDELPEFTDALFGLLDPQFLRPFPSAVVAELRPKPGLISEPTVLPRGTEIRSDPVGPDRAVCRFTTTEDARIQPVVLAEARMTRTQGSVSRLSFSLKGHRGIDISALQLFPLRLYFPDPSKGVLLHLFLTRYASGVWMQHEGKKFRIGGPECVHPAGLLDRMLSTGRHGFSGFRLLQEYLCFRERFWAVDIVPQLDDRLPEGIDEIGIVVEFDRPYPDSPEKRPSNDDLRLHCVPALNLFQMDAEPIRVDHTQSEWKLIASNRFAGSIEVYDVEEVAGIEEGTGKRYDYSPLLDFDHLANGSPGCYFSVSKRRHEDRQHTYLAVGHGDGSDSVPAVQTLSTVVSCTNAQVPHLHLREGTIRKLAPDVAQTVDVSNLTRPGKTLHPPTEDHHELFWSLLSHWSFNYLSVASADALKGLLTLYDWEGRNSRRIEGIADVRWSSKERALRGAVWRGSLVTVEVMDGHFPDEGDLCLFGLVLSHFFGLSATINSFTELEIISNPSGKRYHWQPAQGHRPTI